MPHRVNQNAPADCIAERDSLIILQRRECPIGRFIDREETAAGNAAGQHL